MPVPTMALVNKALQDAEASGSAKRVFDHFHDEWTQDAAARHERIVALFDKAKSEGREVTMGEYIKALEMPYLYGDGPNTHPLASETEAGHNT